MQIISKWWIVRLYNCVANLWQSRQRETIHAGQLSTASDFGKGTCSSSFGFSPSFFPDIDDLPRPSLGGFLEDFNLRETSTAYTIKKEMYFLKGIKDGDTLPNTPILYQTLQYFTKHSNTLPNTPILYQTLPVESTNMCTIKHNHYSNYELNDTLYQMVD